MTMTNWQQYKPSGNKPWNFQRVWMLHRRAGFGATWGELQRDLADGPQKSIDRILDGESRIDGTPPDFTGMRVILGDDAVATGRPERLIAWWIYQMYVSPDPLAERLALIWHNHFATSNRKVKELRLMREQNDFFRQYGRGEFKQLLTKTIKHAAMLKWLDGDENRVGQPNENLGRELLELFTIGVGNYSETDVKESSRALTGWAVSQNEFRNRGNWHDDKPKQILGKSGNFDGDDLVEITIDHPATAKRIAWRLCNDLLGENTADKAAIGKLAKGLSENDLDIKWAVETVLRSELFYSDRNIKRRVVDPEVFIVGAARAAQMFDRQIASTIVLADWNGQLGRTLFYPPNVGGWPGGRNWLNSRTTIARANFGAALVSGNLNRSGEITDFVSLAENHLGITSLENIVGFYSQLLAGESSDEQIKNILTKASARSQNNNETVINAIALILASPSSQLC